MDENGATGVRTGMDEYVSPISCMYDNYERPKWLNSMYKGDAEYNVSLLL
jgi:hypothetical protein